MTIVTIPDFIARCLQLTIHTSTTTHTPYATDHSDTTGDTQTQSHSELMPAASVSECHSQGVDLGLALKVAVAATGTPGVLFNYGWK